MVLVLSLAKGRIDRRLCLKRWKRILAEWADDKLGDGGFLGSSIERQGLWKLRAEVKYYKSCPDTIMLVALRRFAALHSTSQLI